MRRDDVTGDVLLSDRPESKAWRDVFEMTHSIEPSEFMRDRPMNVPPRERDLFAEDR